MTTTAIRVPHKELRPGLKRYEDGDSSPAWDLYLDGELVASEIVSPLEAQTELDQIAWYALFGDAPLLPDAPIPDEALGLALSVFNRLFTAEKVQEKARLARDKIIKPGIYTITAAGDLSVMASSGRGKVAYAVKTYKTQRDGVDAYTVTMECECKDFYARAHEHGGVCKHVAARLLLYLAQRGVGFLKHLRDALDCTGDSQTAPTPTATAATLQQVLDSEPRSAADEATVDMPALAFVEIDATDLLAALRLAHRGGTPVTIRAEHGTLHLNAGPTALTIPGLDGDAAAAAQLGAESFAALYKQLRPAAKTAGVTAIFVEADGTVILDGRGETKFSAIVQGTPIAHTDTCAVDALHELFTLLEQHEPEWYLKRHYRIAQEALRSAGRLAA